MAQPALAGDYGPVMVDEEGFGPSSLLLIIPLSALLGLIVFGFMQSGKKNYKKVTYVEIEENALRRTHKKRDRIDRELELCNQRMQSYLAKPVADKKYT